MVRTSESSFNPYLTNDNSVAGDGARTGVINFDPMVRVSDVRMATSLSAATISSLPDFTIVEGIKSELMARLSDDDEEEGDDEESEHHPHDAPRSGPMHRVIDAPKNPVFGPDGHIESGTDTYEDGSSRFVRYYSPVEIDGVLQSNPQEQTITHPDGSSEYTHYTPDGDVDLIQRTGSSGNVTTYSRRPDGTYAGHTLYADGVVVEGTYNSDFTPIRTVENRLDGSVSTTTYGDSVTTVTRDRYGWEHTTQSTPEGRIIEHITLAPDGSRRVASFPGDGTYLTRNYSPTGELEGSYSIPSELRGHFGQFLPGGGIRIEMNSPTGEPVRTLTVDGTGRVISESSMYPDGRVRETVTYDHEAGTRSIVRFDTRGVQSQSIIGQRYTPPTYAVLAPAVR